MSVEIAGKQYSIAPLTAEQNQQLWVTPDLGLTVWEQWERTITSSLKNGGTPIDKHELAALPYDQMQRLILEISKLTLQAAQAVSKSSQPVIH